MKPRSLLVAALALSAGTSLAGLALAQTPAATTSPAAAPAPSSPPAKPALPARWVRGDERPAPMPPPKERAWGSMQTNHEATFRVRPALVGERVDLGSLPVVEVEPEPAYSPPPATLPPGTAGDVVVLKHGRGRRVSLQGFEAGILTAGIVEVAVGRQSEGGYAGACDGSAHGVLPLRYEGLRRVDAQGSLELVWARGFLDGDCKVAITARTTARPRHVAGGVVYAFRAHCAACKEGQRDQLHVLTPQNDRAQLDKPLPFEHRTLVLSPGRSDAFDAVTSAKGSSWGMPDWGGLVDRQCKSDSFFCIKRVRLEVSWGRGEAAPTAFVAGDLGP
jgi:hypothetical protein